MPDRNDELPTLAQLRARGRSTPVKRSGHPGSVAPQSREKADADQLALFLGGGKEPRLTIAQEDTLRVDDETLPEAGGRARRTSRGGLPKEARRIWSVAALVSDVRQEVEQSYGDVWVEGEISNCRAAGSGHLYLTLKDGEAQLSVVVFRRQAALLRFSPVDGLAVLVRGRVSIYEGRGQLQLIAETMEPRGAGALQVAFEQLKARLLAEGLFDEARKRPLPAFPRCVGIVTSTAGAVLRDIVNVCNRRHSRLNLLVFPATMQGTGCAEEVAAGVRWFNGNRGLVDLIVIARGGGSAEDLAGFNDEELARTIAASELPVVAAIGHETDFTIADFVADLRAPTPSAAAELITAAQHRIEEHVVTLEARVHRAGRYQLLQARQRYARLAAEGVFLRVRDAVERRAQRVDELQLRLQGAAERSLRGPALGLVAAVERLRKQDVAERVARVRRRLEGARLCLDRTPAMLFRPRRARLEQAAARLTALSPLAVLGRGYALIYSADGAVDGEANAAGGALLRSVQETGPGRRVRARLTDGFVTADVTHIFQMEEGKR